MGRFFEIETAKEYYERGIVACVRDISECEFDLSRSERCLDRDNDGTDGAEHWEACIARDRESLDKQKERLTLFRAKLKEANNGHN